MTDKNEQSSIKKTMRHLAVLNGVSSYLQMAVWEELNIQGKKNSEIIAVCIQTNSYWQDLLELLLTDEDYEDGGESFYLIGIYDSYVRDIIIAHEPGEEENLAVHSSDMSVNVAILSDDGCSVFEIEAKNTSLH